MMDIDFEEWLRQGVENGWAGPAVCYTHDGLPTTEAEDTEFEENDPCIHIIRLYDDAEQKKAVEANHSPSVWRASNRGIEV
jgi:hypothetical protein